MHHQRVRSGRQERRGPQPRAVIAQGKQRHVLVRNDLRQPALQLHRLRVYYLAYPLRKFLPLGTVGPRHALTVTNGYLNTFLSHAIYKTESAGAPACRT